MNLKQFTVLVVVVLFGGVFGGHMSDRAASNGQAFANGAENSIDGEDMGAIMDIRETFQKTQQLGGQNWRVTEIILNKILPEKEYASQLETARSEVQKPFIHKESGEKVQSTLLFRSS